MRAAPELRFRLIPYHAVGVAGGLLLAVRSDWTEVAGSGMPDCRLPFPHRAGDGIQRPVGRRGWKEKKP